MHIAESQLPKVDEVSAWLSSLAQWDVFFTGTVKPKKIWAKGTLESKTALFNAVPDDCKYDETRMETSFIGATSLRKSFERFMRETAAGISYVYSLEPHKDAGFHVHAMFAETYGVEKKFWNSFWKKWFNRYGRNRTEPILHEANVYKYVSKYVIKEWGFKNDKRRTVSKEEEIWWNVKLAQQNFRK